MRLLLHGRGCGRTTISCKSHMRWHKGVGNLLPSLGCTFATEGGKAWTPALQEGLPVPPLVDAHPLPPSARCDGKARNIPATAFPGRCAGVRRSRWLGAPPGTG